MGTAIGSVLENMQGFQLVMNFLVMPIFFLSDALYPLNNLPKVFAAVTRIDPLSYGVDGLRTVLIGVSHFGASVDALALAGIAAVLLGVGSYLFSKNSGLTMPRTRSASAHRKVLDAALGLIGESGVEATSVDAIAERSGVSKARRCCWGLSSYWHVLESNGQGSQKSRECSGCSLAGFPSKKPCLKALQVSILAICPLWGRLAACGGLVGRQRAVARLFIPRCVRRPWIGHPGTDPASDQASGPEGKD